MPLNKKPLTTSAAALLLGLALAMPAAAQPGTAAIAQALANIRIDNFGRVNPTYYRGAQPKGHDFADLAALGIKTVIDLAEEGDPGEQRVVQGAGMKFVRIPMTTHVAPTPAQIEQFLSLVNDKAAQPVYVHCQGGRHRTGVMTAVYRMVGGWTADQAFREMKQYKFGADFLHAEFKNFVYAYRTQLDRAAATQAGS